MITWQNGVARLTLENERERRRAIGKFIKYKAERLKQTARKRNNFKGKAAAKDNILSDTQRLLRPCAVRRIDILL